MTIKWQPIETALKDVDILVWFDHDADPYIDPKEPKKLTNYAVWCEAEDFLAGRGWAIAHWFPRAFESTDEYGGGFYLPPCWFAKENDDYMRVCNPTHWVPLSEPQKELE